MSSTKNKIIFLFILNTLFSSFLAQSATINFTSEEQKLDIKVSKELIITAKYDLKSKYKYLYIYTKCRDEGLNLNKGNIRIFFKQISSQDSNKDMPVDYLNSDYSTIDFNSGLFIRINDLREQSAIIYILSYESVNLVLQYKYTNEIVFPRYYKYSNHQLNQFVLKKGETQNITYTIDHDYNDYLLIFSKTSLRNFNVEVTYEGKIANKEKLAYLYPNGCSVFLDREKIDSLSIYLAIKNNNNLNEIISLGYMHHRENQIFPNNNTKYIQFYLLGNKNTLYNLLNPWNKKI